jgi:dTDP-4-dehydrorhamnose 3,5-epimerase
MGPLIELLSTRIDGVRVARSAVYSDHRGAFTRLFCARQLEEVIGTRHILQSSHSRAAVLGAVRGMHFQYPPHAEMKFVRCLKGRIWDVAVDLRAGSSTFLKWHAEELTPENGRALIIPEGCAHGFQVLEADSELLYFHTAFYTPEMEDGVVYDDPLVGIEWPLPVKDVSARDQRHRRLSADFEGIKL